MSSSAYFAKLGGIAAISGVPVLLVATLLHPMDASPSGPQAAFAVRQIEVGLASLVSVFFGLTALMYAVALVSSGARRWLGWLGGIAGTATLSSGVLQASTGFSDLAMVVGMPSNVLLMLWALFVGVYLWQRGGESVPIVGRDARAEDR